MQGYGDIHGLGTGGAWDGLGSLPSPPLGNGWLFDSTLLEGQTIASGTWTCVFRLLRGTYTTFTGTLYCTFWKRSSTGTYTSIGSGSVTANITTTATNYTITATGVQSMAFGTGDKLYIEAVHNKATTGGNAARTVTCYSSSHATLGIANQVDITTPGYDPSPATATKRATGRMNVSVNTDTLNVVGRVSIKGQTTKRAMGRMGVTEQGLISTSTNTLATAYSPSQLTAVSANGDALVVWFDGANVKWSYAAPAYTNWATATLVSNIGGGPRWQAGLYKLPNDDVLVVTSNATPSTVSYYFTYNSGSHSWSVGSPVTVVAGAVQYNGGSMAMDRDAQGRIWATWLNNSSVQQIYYTADNGTSWNLSTTITVADAAITNILGLAYIGNYIVVITYTAGGNGYLRYARVDAHDVTIGSWDAVANITNCTMDNTVVSLSLLGVAGGDVGILAGSGGTLPTQKYTASTNTWSTVTNIGATSDKGGTLISDGTDLYCVWSKYSAANNFSLVYKKWSASSQTWEATSATLLPSGENISWASGGFGGNTLVIAYTKGTASPWKVMVAAATVQKRRATGRINIAEQSTTETTLRAKGRLNVLGSSIKRATGRLRFFPQITRNATGRLRYIGQSIRRAAGRVKVVTQQTRNAAGRALVAVTQTKRATGRTNIAGATGAMWRVVGLVRLGVTHLSNGVGRLRLAVQQTRRSMGRMIVASVVIRRPTARLRLGVQTTKRSTGRQRFFPQVVRNVVARLRFHIQTIKRATGRQKLLGRHLSHIMGYIRLQTENQTVSNAKGRLKLVATQTYNASGRVVLGIVHTLRSRGRLVLRGKTTSHSVARFKYASSVTRRVSGRFLFVNRTVRYLTTRMRLSVSTTQNAIGRISLKSAQIWRSVGRLRVSALVVYRANGRLRIAIPGQITYRGLGRTKLVTRQAAHATGRMSLIVGVVDAVFTIATQTTTFGVGETAASFTVPLQTADLTIAYNRSGWDIADNTLGE